jgi:hypothetical protein
MRKAIFATLIILCVLVVAMPAIADSGIGRYQVVKMDVNSVFIIDTKDGHFWAWEITEDGISFLYLGIVKPGTKAPQTIYTTTDYSTPAKSK